MEQLRKGIDLKDSIMDILILMSEGNPGAATVLAQLMQDRDMGLIAIMHLDDMNIRGTQIWIGYKEYCKENIENFKEAIFRRDPIMIAKINEEGLRGNHSYKATTGQASY